MARAAPGVREGGEVPYRPVLLGDYLALVRTFPNPMPPPEECRTASLGAVPPPSAATPVLRPALARTRSKTRASWQCPPTMFHGRFTGLWHMVGANALGPLFHGKENGFLQAPSKAPVRRGPSAVGMALAVKHVLLGEEQGKQDPCQQAVWHGACYLHEQHRRGSAGRVGGRRRGRGAGSPMGRGGPGRGAGPGGGGSAPAGGPVCANGFAPGRVLRRGIPASGRGSRCALLVVEHVKQRKESKKRANARVI